MYSKGGGGLQSSNQEKIGQNSLLVLFFSTGPIILAKRHDMKYETMYDFQKLFFEKQLQFGTL